MSPAEFLAWDSEFKRAPPNASDILLARLVMAVEGFLSGGKAQLEMHEIAPWLFTARELREIPEERRRERERVRRAQRAALVRAAVDRKGAQNG